MIKLPKLKEFLKKFSSKEWGSMAFATELLDLEILPVLSDPNSQDSDADYYKDSLDPQPLKRTPMIIYDNKIDDTLVFGDTAAPKEKQINTLSETIEIDDGTLIYTDPKIKNKPKFQYDRIMSDPKNTRIHTFTLTPRNNSDYRFTLSHQKNDKFIPTLQLSSFFSREIKPTYKEVVDINGSISYSYTLKANVKYTITVNGISPATDGPMYSMIAEQDNWVYAPEGGVWESDYCEAFVKNRHLSGYNLMYLPEQKLFETISVNSSGKTQFFTILKEEQNKEEQIKFIFNQLHIDYSKFDFNSILKAIAGGALLIISKGVASPIIKIISNLTGDILTLSGALDAFGSLTEYIDEQSLKKALEKGNFNLICDRFTQYSNTVRHIWYSWNSYPYINKYTYDTIFPLAVKGNLQLNNLSLDKINKWCNFGQNYEK